MGKYWNTKEIKKKMRSPSAIRGGRLT
jgi:hypothetical protein